MTIDINLSTIISSLLSALALAGIIGIFRTMKTMNGNIRELQTWTAGHEKIDDERHVAQQVQNKNLWDAIQWIRERLTG